MMLRLWRTALVCLGANLAACSGEEQHATLLVALIDAEPALRSELTRVDVESARGKKISLPVDAESWPLSVAIQITEGRASGPLAVRAYTNDKERVRRTAQLKRDAAHDRVWNVHLSQVCEGRFQACDDQGLGTCLPCEGECKSIDLSLSALRLLTKGSDPRDGWEGPLVCTDDLDAGQVDGEAAPDATTDAGPRPDGGSPQDGGDADASTAQDGGAQDSGTNELVAPSVPLAVSTTHACAIRGVSRHVYCWGDNRAGQLGTTESPPDWLTPLQIKRPDGEPLSGAIQVAVGHGFSCALLDDARAYCWGERGDFQTGTRGRGLATRPYPVVLAEGGSAPEYLPLESIVYIVAGDSHSCALDAKGDIYCWGQNEFQQLGVASASFAIDGAVRVTLPNDRKARLLGRSGETTCAVTAEDELFCWGSNWAGQAGIEPQRDDAGVPVYATAPTPNAVEVQVEAKPITQVTGGDTHLALLANGSVWTWGSSFFGQLGRTIDVRCDDTYDVYCSTVPGHAAQFGESATFLMLAGSNTCVVVGPEAELRCLHGTLVEHAGAPLQHVTFAAGDTYQVSGTACVQTADDKVYCWGKFFVPDPEPAGDLGTYPDAIQVALP